jgi:hypothetical protein
MKKRLLSIALLMSFGVVTMNASDSGYVTRQAGKYADEAAKTQTGSRWERAKLRAGEAWDATKAKVSSGATAVKNKAKSAYSSARGKVSSAKDSLMKKTNRPPSYNKSLESSTYRGDMSPAPAYEEEAPPAYSE